MIKDKLKGKTMTDQLATLTTDEDVSIITLDDGKANVFSTQMSETLNSLLDQVPEDKGVREFCKKNECIYTSVYGQTEVTGLITSISGEDFWIYPGSVGKPVSDMNMEIWDEEGRSLGPGCIGEIMAKSSRCIHNYWNNEEATKLLYTREWLPCNGVSY